MNTGSGKTVVLLILALAVGFGSAFLLSPTDDDVAVLPRDHNNCTDNQITERSKPEPDKPETPILQDIEIPKPETPAPPKDRSTWQLTGEIPGALIYGHVITIRLLHADTNEPIPSFCKLWPMNYPLERFADFDHTYKMGNWCVPRSAWPSLDGDLLVRAKFDTSEDTHDLTYMEVPIPVGYQLAVDIRESLKQVSPLNPTATLYFKPRPNLKVRVQTLDGEPVWDAQVYAIPVKPSAAMEAWAAWRSSVYAYSDETEKNPADQAARMRREFNKDIEEYFSNPFFVDTVEGFRQNHHPSSADEPFYPKLNATATNDDGLCVLGDLYAGEWEVGVFVSGRGDFQRKRVELGSGIKEVYFTTEKSEIARVNIEVHFDRDESLPEELIGLDIFPDGLMEAVPEFRLRSSREFWPRWAQLNGGDTARFEYRFQKECDWLFFTDYCTPLRFRSKLGETQNFRVDLTEQDDIETGTMYTELYLAGAKQQGYFEAYDQHGEVGTYALNESNEMLPGVYISYLPAGQSFEFTVVSGKDLTQRYDIKQAALTLKIDKWMFDEIVDATFTLNDLSEFELEVTEEDFKNGFAVITRNIVPGVHKYSFDQFGGTFRILENESITLEFTKDKCSGLVVLELADETTSIFFYPTIARLSDYYLENSNYLIQTRPNSAVSATLKVIRFMVGQTHLFYIPAGNYIATIGSTELLVSAPSSITVTDELFYTAHAEWGVVGILEADNAGPESWDISYHCIHESGAAYDVSADGNRMPYGNYDLFVIVHGHKEGIEFRRYAEHQFIVSERELTIEWQHLAWHNMTRIEVQLYGTGDTLNGNMSWWHGETELQVECPTRYWRHVLNDFEATSLNPPIQKTEIWLADGEYQIVPWLGADAIIFKVGADEPDTVIINSDK